MGAIHSLNTSIQVIEFDIGEILSAAGVPVEDPRFYPGVFKALSAARREQFSKIKDPLKKVAGEEYEILSERLDESEVQESCSVRNNIRARELANLLVSDEGALDLEALPILLQSLKENLYSLGPNRQHDAVRQEHIIAVLTTLQENPKIARQLRIISKPHMHRFADQIIRETLDLPPKTVVTDAHARRAVLSAWLCYLRQNVGSCFATAPAIIVHDEQPEFFLKDLQELLSTGRLKRIVRGKEYAVPLSFSWGAGDLRRVFLFQKEGTHEDFKIWQSPGFIEALQQIGAIARDLPEAEKTAASKALICKVLDRWDTKHPWFYASLEDVLRKVVLSHFELTEQDVEDYLSRPKGMIHSGLLMTSSKEKGGIGRRCQEFLERFEEAKNAFKGLADNALLKTWEFTIASFAETKSEFTNWNLYSSLGLSPNDKGGLGPCLYEILKRKLDECNEKVHNYQWEYEQLYAQIQYLQRKIRNASSEKEAQWIRIEYQTKSSEFRTIEELRDKFSHKARRYANLFDGLVDLYFRLFPDYFQEIYDADIHEVTTGPFDDSPAGFRLLFKHGRSNTSQWTRIHNHMDFIDALGAFFTATETELTHAPEMKGLEDDVREITTAIVSHVRSEEFLETAFHRMARAHNAPLIKDPLQNLDKIQKKPWVYTSGGAMRTLVTCYFRLEDKPREVSRWVENPMELLVFLIDAVKEMGANEQQEFIDNPRKSLLIHSPTHAFLLKPGFEDFKNAWQSKQFSYTWARDEVLFPMKDFVSKIYLDGERMAFLVNHLAQKVPVNFRHYFKETFRDMGGSMQLQDFRNYLLDGIELNRGLQYAGRGALTAEQIDSELFTLMPLFPSYKLKDQVKNMVEHMEMLSDLDRARILDLVEDISGRVGTESTISAKGLQNIMKAMLSMVFKATATEHNFPQIISRIAQKLGMALPRPFTFADTNWVTDYFSFVVNPGSGELELWRVDCIGRTGAPMAVWKHWLDGSKKHPDWGVYNHPHEYQLG